MNCRRQNRMQKLLNRVGARALAGLPRLADKIPARLWAVVPVLSSLFVVGNAHASGDEAGHHEPHVQNWISLSPADNAEAPAIVWMAVTFAAFAIIIKIAAGRPFANFLEMRHLTVKTAIEEAKKAKADAERTQREFEEKLARLDDDIAALRSEFEGRGRLESDRLEAAGKAAAVRIMKDAESTIHAELKQAEESLKTEASRLAVEVAQQKIMAALTDADDKRIRKEFLDGLAN